MQRVIPTLRLPGYAGGRQSHAEGLGFRIDREHRFGPAPPVSVRSSLDGMPIYPAAHAGDREVGGLVHFIVTDVDALHAEFARRGVPVPEAPDEGIAGLRMMTPGDPDGNQPRSFTRLAA